jgi:hypothetical protein
VSRIHSTAGAITRGGRDVLRIGGASGAWGDSPVGIGPLLAAGVDVLMMDYLAEVTMSLLARARLKDPEAGYPPDVISYLSPHLADIARRGVRVVTNAGGVNPQACKRALEQLIAQSGLALKVAVVEGDDLLPMLDSLRAEGTREWQTGEPIPQKMLTANAYLGAEPIAVALDAGADIVITGRCVDSALALGALIHAFGWEVHDYDRLAAGSLVGHLLECGPQATGGLSTDWREVPDWASIGYPIATCAPDGSFTIGKPEGSGGLVTPQTVAEQVLYEVGDPSAYVLPDVVADFSQVHLEQVGVDCVRVTGVRGCPPTSTLKVSATWQSGWRATAMIVIIGEEAVAKAERSAEALLTRARSLFQSLQWPDFDAVHIEVLGAEASYGRRSRARGAREVVLRLVVDHRDPRALNLFAREVGSSALSFAQGTAALIGGRPKPTPIVRLFSFLVDKQRLPDTTVQLGSDSPLTVPLPMPGDIPVHRSNPTRGPRADVGSALQRPAASLLTDRATRKVALRRFAYARSGDKGDNVNVAILCRNPEHFAWLRDQVTEDRMAEHFADMVQGPVERFEVPGLHALNFLMHRALGGGGMAARQIDALGKAYGQQALELEIDVPAEWCGAPCPASGKWIVDEEG